MRYLGADLWDDELSSAFVFIEGILNDRPLDFLFTDTSDIEPWTPAHFVVGLRVQGMAFADLDRGSPFSRRWQHVNATVERCWDKFTREIKPCLGIHGKWHSSTQNLEVGDVIVVIGERYLRGRWPLGRIEETHPGKDGLVRVITVEVQGRLLKRHINCVMPLLKKIMAVCQQVFILHSDNILM